MDTQKQTVGVKFLNKGKLNECLLCSRCEDIIGLPKYPACKINKDIKYGLYCVECIAYLSVNKPNWDNYILGDDQGVYIKDHKIICE